MERKFIVAEGITLSYLDNNKIDTPAIIFMHGNSQSTSAWLPQLEDELLNQYRLLAFDMPSHGFSGISINPYEDYTLSGLGKIMAAAIKQLQIDQYLLGGLSLGTNIVIEMLPYLTPKGIFLVSSSILGLECPLEKIMLNTIDAGCLFSDTNDVDGFKNLLMNVFAHSHSNKIADLFLQDYQNVKPPFRSLLLKSVVEGTYTDGIEAIKKIGLPLFVAFGKNESIVDPFYLHNISFNKWRNEVFVIPDANHFLNIDQPAVFNLLLFEYATDIYKAPN